MATLLRDYLLEEAWAETKDRECGQPFTRKEGRDFPSDQKISISYQKEPPCSKFIRKGFDSVKTTPACSVFSEKSACFKYASYPSSKRETPFRQGSSCLPLSRTKRVVSSLCNNVRLLNAKRHASRTVNTSFSNFLSCPAADEEEELGQILNLDASNDTSSSSTEISRKISHNDRRDNQSPVDDLNSSTDCNGSAAESICTAAVSAVGSFIFNKSTSNSRTTGKRGTNKHSSKDNDSNSTNSEAGTVDCRNSIKYQRESAASNSDGISRLLPSAAVERRTVSTSQETPNHTAETSKMDVKVSAAAFRRRPWITRGAAATAVDSASFSTKARSKPHASQALQVQTTARGGAAVEAAAHVTGGGIAETDRYIYRLMSSKQQLPILQFADTVKQTVMQQQVTLIVGETGSGKSTQVPQLVLQLDNVVNKKTIGITQPRRVAAVSLARRVAEEMHCLPVGGTVGYAVRFEEKCSPRTRIKYLTDGLLLREAVLDPLLSRYSVLILDEVHERSVRTDVLLGLLKLLLQKRSDLKVLLMSAALDCAKLQTFFPQVATLNIPGRQFPVELFYTPAPEEDYVEAAYITAMQIHATLPSGDILVFLPGQDDIEGLQALLEEKQKLLRNAAALALANEARQQPSSVAADPAISVTRSEKTAQQCSLSTKEQCNDGNESYMQEARLCLRIGDETYMRNARTVEFIVCTLFAALPFDQQKLVFEPPPKGVRKIILATNLAETSITVPGIRYVVDTGLAKNKKVNHLTGAEALVVEETSKDAALQRAGRAGREAPGKVFRLYTEDTFNAFVPRRVPEILGANLGGIYLELKALGIENPSQFPFLDPPPNEALFNAGRELHRLDALDSCGELTALGRRLAALPLAPILGKLLLESINFGCTSEILTIIAMLSTESLWICTRPHGKDEPKRSKARIQLINDQSDHLTLLNAYMKWEEVCQTPLSRSNMCFDIMFGRQLSVVAFFCCLKLSTQAHDKVGFCKEYGLHHNALKRAALIRSQLEGLMKVLSSDTTVLKKGDSQNNWASIRQCLAASCWLRSARLQRDGSTYMTAVDRLTAKIHPSSGVFGKIPLPQYVVYSEYIQTTKPYLRCVTAIEGTWLQQLVSRWFSVVGQTL